MFSDNRATSTASAGGGICCKSSSSPVIRSNTISGNAGTVGGGIYLKDSAVTLTNNLITFSTAGGGIYLSSGTLPTVNYCDVYGNVGGNYVGGAAAGTSCLEADPLYAGADTGDFHLQSTAGHWDGAAWVVDPVSSPCIDAGDPASAFVNEPEPNGDRSLAFSTSTL